MHQSLKDTFGCHVSGHFSPADTQDARTAHCVVDPELLLKAFARPHASLFLPEKVQPSVDCHASSDLLQASLVSAERVVDVLGQCVWTVSGLGGGDKGRAILAGTGTQFLSLFRSECCL